MLIESFVATGFLMPLELIIIRNLYVVHTERKYQFAKTFPCMNCKETIPKIITKYSLKKELRCLSPNFHIHVSASDLYIPTIDLPILLQEICGPILGIYINRSQTDVCGNWD
jgi:hypothetical protein